MIEERLSMYDDLMENDPKIRKELRIMILAFAQRRFPSLIEQARQKIKQLKIITELSDLYLELIGVNDELTARKLFTS